MRKEPLITAAKVDKVKELIESNTFEDKVIVILFCILLFLRITRKNFSSR